MPAHLDPAKQCSKEIKLQLHFSLLLIIFSSLRNALLFVKKKQKKSSLFIAYIRTISYLYCCFLIYEILHTFKEI